MEIYFNFPKFTDETLRVYPVPLFPMMAFSTEFPVLSLLRAIIKACPGV